MCLKRLNLQCFFIPTDADPAACVTDLKKDQTDRPSKGKIYNQALCSIHWSESVSQGDM